MKKGLTEIVCILDRSGSMASTIDDAIGGFNTFIESQKAVPGEAKVSIVLFDNECDLIENGSDINIVKNLNKSTYVPRGMTALLDAIGKTIDTIGTRLANTEEDNRPEKVLVAILTDGAENASKEFTNTKIYEMIERQKSVYKWNFCIFSCQSRRYSNWRSIGYRCRFMC